MTKTAFEQEAIALLHFWNTQVLSPTGFVPGSLDGFGKWDHQAPVGLVLHARILWTFAKAAEALQDPAYLSTAERVYQCIESNFSLPTPHPGFAWSLDANLRPLDTKQQVYGLAFVIYAYATYFKVCQKSEVLDKAVDVFLQIEEQGWDSLHGGYWEVFPSGESVDIRLSEKDFDAPKSMNTHLHVLEGYAALYEIWPDPRLAQRIRDIVHIFHQTIWQKSTKHLGLFFAADWSLVSQRISFGHEIEAAWLIPACAQVLGPIEGFDFLADWPLQLTQAALEGWDADSFWHEYDPEMGEYDTHREWWVSAEAMVGFWDTYVATKDPVYQKLAATAWSFIQNRLKDKKAGEWFWGIDPDGIPMQSEPKAGFWKCPYHTVRACLEMRDRVSAL